MNAPLARDKLERFAKLLAEQRRRNAKSEQSTYGWYDENGVRQGGLIAFVRYFWSVLEPETPLVDGWPLWAMCEHLEKVTAGAITRLLINVPPGFMKALDDDTPVLTTWGWKKHGDLQPGDFVFGPDGLPKRVIACTDKKLEESYSVRFDDGAEIIAGAGHLWSVERDVASVKPHYRRGRKPEVVPTTDLRVSGYKHNSDYKKRPDRIKISEPIAMPPRRLLIDPYVLGAWLGDGSSSSAIIYAGAEDAQHFSRLGRVTHVTPPTPPRKQAFYHIHIEGMQKRLRILGLLGNKHIPDDYLDASIEQRWELLRGLMDTDGTCGKNGSCSFVNKNKEIADGFVQLCRSLGLKAWKTETWSTVDGVKFGPYQYVNFIPPVGVQIFKLERKQARVRGNMNERSRNRYVDAVEPVGLRSVKCIQVEGSLYLAGRELVPTHNSMMVDVFWPAWEWGPMGKTHYRYVAFSYSASLTERDNDRFRTLITHASYQRLYGPFKTSVQTAGVGLRNKTTLKVMNTHTGWKLASSVGGVGTGERGDRIIIDDPHNVTESESETVRALTTRWFRESISSRFNNLETGALIIIMQRVHEDDVSGVILAEGFDYCHLCIPWEYERDRQFNDDGTVRVNPIGWLDPRFDEDDDNQADGEPAWPERFTPDAMERTRQELGPYAWAGQYQQSPSPRGGGIFQRDWWQLWAPADGKFPEFDFIIASLDGAFTEKEQNCPSALTVWGIFLNDDGQRRIMLIDAWRKHLKFSAPRNLIEPLPKGPRLVWDGEGWRGSPEWFKWRNRTMPQWGLMEWLMDSCNRRKVDKLLIEAKGPGISAAQELQNRFGRQHWSVQPCQVKGDKVARALAVQATFSQLVVYAPALDWAQMVIDEMAVFPNGRYSDLTDSATQALSYLRGVGMAQTDDEVDAAAIDRVTHQSRPRKAIYPV